MDERIKFRRIGKLMGVICVFVVLFTVGTRRGFTQEAGSTMVQGDTPKNPQGWGDDGIREVGVEWINDFPGTANDRDHWDESCDGLYNGLTSVGWTGRFHWTDWNAYETDFKLASLGGEEDTYVDNVDIAMVCTHGAGTHDNFWNKDLSSVYFGTTHADQHLSPGDAYRAYGDKDLEFLAFDSCSVLSDGGPAPYYNRGYWSTTMNGLHLLLGFNNTMYVWAPGDGTYWSFFMKGLGWFFPSQTVTQAWFSAVDYNQPTVTCARVLAEAYDNFNDHLYGYGYLGPDPAVDGYYYYWDHCSTGAKKLDLTSYKATQQNPSVPQFVVQHRQVDLNYIDNIIAPAFAITGTVGEDDMFFYLLDTSGGITRTVMVDKNTGSYNFRNWGKLWTTPTITPTLPSSGRIANSLASNFFSQTPAEGLPAAWYRNAGMNWTIEYINLASELLEGNSVQAITHMPADGMLTYDRNLDWQGTIYPLVGPGARLKIYFGDGNQIVGVMGGSRDVMATKAMVEVMTAGEAWAMYLADPTVAIPEVPWVAESISYTAAALGYYEMPYTTPQDELIPVWIFNANFYGPDKALLAGDVPVYIPASVAYLPPVVSITTPISGTLFSPNQTIHFVGNVSGGKPPYTFKWTSSIDGLLGDTQTINVPLTGAAKSNEALSHAIKFEVTDANGQSGTATIYVKVRLQVFLPMFRK